MIRALLILVLVVVPLVVEACSSGSSGAAGAAGSASGNAAAGDSALAGANSIGGATGAAGSRVIAGAAGALGTAGAMGMAGTGGLIGTGGGVGVGGTTGGEVAGTGGGLASGGGGGATGASGSGGSSGHANGGGGGASGAQGIAKIMAIGDSITRATCWRDFLWQQLEQNFSGRFDLVGTLNADYGCGVKGFDGDNQGYSSSLITEVVAGVTNARTCDPSCPALSDVKTAFNVTRPNVVLMHWGTNDVWNGKSTSSITSAYSQVIDAARAANPAVTVLLAQLIPMNVTGTTCSGCSCASCGTAVPALNTAITAFATTKSTPTSRVIVVDQYTGFNAMSDTRDGVHPNTTGSQKMAARWYDALTANQLVR